MQSLTSTTSNAYASKYYLQVAIQSTRLSPLCCQGYQAMPQVSSCNIKAVGSSMNWSCPGRMQGRTHFVEVEHKSRCATHILQHPVEPLHAPFVQWPVSILDLCGNNMRMPLLPSTCQVFAFLCHHVLRFDYAQHLGAQDAIIYKALQRAFRYKATHK